MTNEDNNDSDIIMLQDKFINIERECNPNGPLSQSPY